MYRSAELTEYVLSDSTRNKDSTFCYYMSVNKCIDLKVQIGKSPGLLRMLSGLSGIPLPDAASARLLLLLDPLLLCH